MKGISTKSRILEKMKTQITEQKNIRLVYNVFINVLNFLKYVIETVLRIFQDLCYSFEAPFLNSSLFLRRYAARYSMGFGGLSLAKVDKPPSKIGTIV